MTITITAFERSPDGGKGLAHLALPPFGQIPTSEEGDLARGEARPAYQRAFDAQLAINTAKPSTG